MAYGLPGRRIHGPAPGGRLAPASDSRRLHHRRLRLRDALRHDDGCSDRDDSLPSPRRQPSVSRPRAGVDRACTLGKPPSHRPARLRGKRVRTGGVRPHSSPALFGARTRRQELPPPAVPSAGPGTARFSSSHAPAAHAAPAGRILDSFRLGARRRLMVTMVRRATFTPSVDTCVSVDLDSRAAEREREYADVLYGTATHSPTALLGRYPGCLCVSLRSPGFGHQDAWCHVMCRNGGRLLLTGRTGLRPEEHRRLVTAVHAWLTQGLALDRLQAVHLRGHPSDRPILSFRRRSSSRSVSLGLTGR